MSLGEQHIHARRRIFERLEPFPSADAFKRFLDYLMYGVGLAAPLALVPQIVGIYGNHNAAGVSLATWLLLGVANILWAIYGIVHKEKQIYFANGLIAIFDLVIVIGVLLY